MRRTIIVLTALVIFNICTIAQNNNETSQLPVLRMTGNFGYEYQQGTVTIEYANGSKEENLTASIKWRGGSTNTEGKHKRNYKIKFTEDHSFFGMRNDNNWILDAGQADVFRLRNRIATELWEDFSVKPYYADKEPNAMSCVRGQVVEVYLNDEYRGIYSLTECMDRKQMKLKKFEKNGTIHGILWKTIGYGSSMMYTVPESYDNSQSLMDDVFEAKYPEPGDDLPSTDYSILWDAINFTVNSSNEEFANHVAEYFDVPVLVDYYLFVNLLSAIDNTGKNMYWAVYDKQEDKKITPAVWDLDMTMGARSLEQFNKSFSSPDFAIGDALNVITRLKELNVDNFNEKVTQRYRQLRQTYFSPNNLIARYQKYYQLLKACGAAEREQNLWSEDSDVAGEVIDFDAEILYISNWITKHIKYLDENYFDYQEGTGIKSITSSDSKDTKNIIYHMDGRPVNHPNRLQKGIYICNGKKYVNR